MFGTSLLTHRPSSTPSTGTCRCLCLLHRAPFRWPLSILLDRSFQCRDLAVAIAVFRGLLVHWCPLSVVEPVISRADLHLYVVGRSSFTRRCHFTCGLCCHLTCGLWQSKSSHDVLRIHRFILAMPFRELPRSILAGLVATYPTKTVVGCHSWRGL